MSEIEELPVSRIRTDGDTQPRVGGPNGLNLSTVAEYAERMKAGDKFPPIVCFFDGENYWLADGFHRLQAWKDNTPLEPILAEIHLGTQRDAILYSVGANAQHGLPRSNEDKRQSVLRLLNDPEWEKWSDNQIARRCHVSQPFVSKLRKTNNVISSDRMYTRNGAVATMKTNNIGGNSNGSFPDPAQVAYEWLKNYVGADGRRWHDLTENQTWHANSPCWQAFSKDNPKLSKGYLKHARQCLEAERVHKKETTPVAGARGDNDEWYTPAWLIDMTREVIGEIDLDPASSDEAQTIVKAKRHWTKMQNALNLNWIVNINGPNWSPSRVFLNPPYSHPLVEQFIDKLLQQIEKGHVSEAILLVNNNTETAWWHKAAAAANAILFFRSRVFFWRPGQAETTSPRQGQNLFYFGPNTSQFAITFSSKGITYLALPIQETP